MNMHDALAAYLFIGLLVLVVGFYAACIGALVGCRVSLGVWARVVLCPLVWPAAFPYYIGKLIWVSAHQPEHDDWRNL